jgi:predicted nucleic acid-binding protein
VLIRVAEFHRGLYCGKIIGEYLEKLVDLKHPPQRAVKMIAYLMGAFVRVEVMTAAAPVRPTDPDDEVFVLCALDGQADYLVSEDRALLDLRPSYAQPVIGKSVELAPALGA